MGRPVADTGLLPSLERLREVLSFDPVKGSLVWIAKTHPKATKLFIGAPAGSMCERGYINVTIDRKPYAVHRVVWKMHYGVEPPEFIDHKNRNEWDFRIDNLRPATQSQNNANRSVTSASGIKGVRHYSSGAYDCWLASYKEDGKKKAKAFPYTDEGLEIAIAWRAENAQRVNGEYAR